MGYMAELCAQRAHFINTFYATKLNVDSNRSRLIACTHQLVNQQHILFVNADIDIVLSLLLSDKAISDEQFLLTLQLYARVHDNAALLIDYLYLNAPIKVQKWAPKLALILKVSDYSLSATCDEKVLHNQLLVCYYRQQFKSISDFSTLYTEQVSSLTRLYLSALNKSLEIDKSLLDDFIVNDYLHSELFELYVISLTEDEISTIVNQLSKDKQNIHLMIKVIGLSGYSVFIPLLARYLQNKLHTIAAHHALRTTLGETLDKLIPKYIQFNSEQSQRIEDLCYYGAKILHHWDDNLQSTLPKRLLSGLPITIKNLDSLLETGSQVHRRVAALHKTQFPINGSVFYYSCPEVVL